MKTIMMKAGIAVVALTVVGVCGITPVMACGFEGSATRTDGSKVDGTETVSNSWNSTKAYPRGGWYSLELGSSACGESIELYVGGNSLGRHSVPSSGNARVDFVLKGTSSTPVR